MKHRVERHAEGLAAALLVLAGVLGCARPSTLFVPPAASVAIVPAPADASPPPVFAPAPAPVDSAPLAPEPPPPPSVSLADARRILFADDASAPTCADASIAAAVHCFLAARYSSDPRAAAVATSLYDATGDVAGLSSAETMEGGFRGVLHLVPELPVGARRKHLEWVASSVTDYDDFFQRLTEGVPQLPRYRWHALSLRFMRSVGRTTPSAYAEGWSIAYNVDGSLNTSRDAVRELLFHEIFHLNDSAHGDWSKPALGPIFDGLIARCHASTACLRPYAPSSTLVRGGTYYAFQPTNGDAVHEYAAELAIRYYEEERAILHGEPPLPRFKCGPTENGRAWTLLVNEFFGGIDRTPPCP